MKHIKIVLSIVAGILLLMFCPMNVSAKHYDGTDAEAYGYGGIVDPATYLKDRYGGTPQLSDKGKTLQVNAQTMKAISGKSANNCTLVSITKLMIYWRDYRNKYHIPTANGTVYRDVETIAKKYGYTDSKGTNPTKINNIMNDIIRKYFYTPKTSGIYVWTFNGQVKKEVDAGRPVTMNIARGYYGNHSVTVVGYKIYKVNGKTYPMIQVSDGWKASYRYIDYNAFAYDLMNSGFGSFNTMQIN